MTHTLPETLYECLVGDLDVAPQPRVPFNDEACAFLAHLAHALRADERARQFADLQTFAFWCRPANIHRLKAHYTTGTLRLGRGLVLHIAPGNVPVTTAYTFAFGLLAGNANMVRLPSRPARQLEIFCDIVNRAFLDPVHAQVKAGTAFLQYPSTSNLTARLSATCQGRVVWGGDATIQDIRRITLPERAVEIAFADRYSLCVLDAEAVNSASDFDMTRLAEAFYNDTYLMDQAACSSPHVVLWQGSNLPQAKDRFWSHVARRVDARYHLAAVHAVDKYVDLLEAAITGHPTSLRRHGNSVYVLGVGSLVEAPRSLRGRFGLFYEKDIATLADIARHATPKYQTLTYYGFSREQFRDLVVGETPMGIDRIVPVGEALDLDVVWDGHDIIHGLSRIVDIR